MSFYLVTRESNDSWTDSRTVRLNGNDWFVVEVYRASNNRPSPRAYIHLHSPASTEVRGRKLGNSHVVSRIFYIKVKGQIQRSVAMLTKLNTVKS